MQSYYADNGNDTGYKLHEQKFKAIGNKETKHNDCNDMYKQSKAGIIKCPDNNRYKAYRNSHDVRNIDVHYKGGE